jgi:superoxide dismutase
MIIRIKTERTDDFIADGHDSGKPEAYRDAIHFNASGHANHIFFCKLLKQCVEDSEDLGKVIDDTFRCLPILQEKVTLVTTVDLGSGWAWSGTSEKNTGELFVST